ncbi:NADPH:quinone reductase-like Zn-dependent oxidoreductase [Kribbella antiqua]|uniref:NADPH:quinone reductase-like Zn-dependent oxidoreductase n=1 Tax=Kribbella antiqua TaxID=2512217 RepID=A0A4R2IMB5_9ACTN|nr:NADP-dependent oxidoreductase [Kribbella antiqua]TCO45516.1 NADPH:quinone reductase-like Zn-dependent oxidoreductase [Kribbella antiqua]
MRALVARRLEGPDALEVIETPVPEPAAGQVRIKVAAAAVNPVDVAVSTGKVVQYGVTAPREQFGLGWDVAGTIDAIGEGVDLTPGTPVIGLADLLGLPLKTHAEYVVLNADAVAPAPKGLDLTAASTIALNALTALQALKALQLTPGQTLLVTGAAGGVGGYAVELGKRLDLTVIASAGEEDEDLVRRLGADHFVPKDLTAVHTIAPAGVDGLVDAAVRGIAAQEAVRNRGWHAHVQAGPTPPHLRGITVEQIFVQANRSELQELVQLVEAGVLSTRVADTYPLHEAPAAYNRLAKGGVRGRLVLVN